MSKTNSAKTRAAKRCAIYTRKSSEEGLDQEFNSLDAQRESAEAYIKSQAHEGWTCLAQRYDDGGYTGGSMDRPALARLLRDVEAGGIDCVIVYKVDRLSRSLLDFARILELFERRGVSFVSVTQQFHTGTSMGRLMLNVLLSFAQFEREIISERTRDKIAAARRRGKWSGGTPLLGYDVIDRRLVINEGEAQQVRVIFEIYVKRRSLLAVVQELAARGWTNKVWTTRKGNKRGGRPFNKTSLHQLLTNATYTGKVRHKGELFDGEHMGVVEHELFDRVQRLLREGKNNACRSANSEATALLRGLARCAACDRAMAHSYASRGTRRYRYYVCTAAQKQGWHVCPSPSVPAGELERFVVERLRGLARDRAQLAARWAAWRQCAAESQRKGQPGVGAPRDKQGDESAVLCHASGPDVTEDSAEQQVGLEEFAVALRRFDHAWDDLAPPAQAELLKRVVRQVDYDGRAGRIAIHFCPMSIAGLAAEATQQEEMLV